MVVCDIQITAHHFINLLIVFETTEVQMSVEFTTITLQSHVM